MRPESCIGERFFELGEVDSTNNYAMRKVQEQMAVHGTTFFAQYQNAGKGQRGKQWKAAPGENITMSCVLEPSFLSIDNQFLLNIIVTLACHNFFTVYTNGDVWIKWPNDIYWKDRKAGGILIENLVQGYEWRFSIAGIGLNINQTLFNENLSKAVSLKQITGKNFDVISLAKKLCIFLDQRWKQIKNNNESQENLLNEYNSYLYKKNQMVTFIKQGQQVVARVIGVTVQGKLLVTRDGHDETFDFGSVQWLLSN